MQLFEVGRRQFARILRQLDDLQFDRVGTHSRAGVLRLGGTIQGYADHLDHDLKFLNAKRGNLAKRR